MNLLLVCVHFPPKRSSCAVQMRDLAIEFQSKGHIPTVLVPENNLNTLWKKEIVSGINVYRLKCPKIIDISFLKRAINEFLLPFFMLRAIKKSDLNIESFDGVIWYSPTIFFGPVISYLKKIGDMKSYLILRDIFPEWANDLGLMKKGIAYYLFKSIAKYQYSVANTIGVQTESNKLYFLNWKKRNKDRKLEVLNNWLSDTYDKESSIQLKNTSFKGKKIFVYIGNMGVAQDMQILIDLAESFKSNDGIGFLFVGRGTMVDELKQSKKDKNLKNVLFYNEIDPNEIFGLLKMCDVGMVALDPNHKSHNIPGKFLTYMQAGIPVLARINKNTDLEHLINSKKVGEVYTDSNVNELNKIAKQLLDSNEQEFLSNNCRNLYKESYSSDKAVKIILKTFEDKR